MRQRVYKISEYFDIIISMPFRVSENIKSIPLESREVILQALANGLNEKLSEYKWSVNLFNQQNQVPIPFRKYIAFLFSERKNTKNLKKKIQDSFKAQYPFLVQSVEESIYYLDWDLGTVETKIQLCMNGINDLNGITEFKRQLKLLLAKELYVFNNWEFFDTEFNSALRNYHLIDDEYSFNTENLKFGKLDALGSTVIFNEIGKKGITLNKEQVSHVFANCIGHTTESNVFVLDDLV